MTILAHDVDLRQELLGRIRTHQASINTYVHKMQGRRGLVTNISIVSSVIAAALMVGPTAGGPSFTEAVAKGLGWADDSPVWRSLCLTAVIVNVVAAISAQLGKSSDLTERIVTVEACNAALEELGTDVEFSKHSVELAAAEYGKIAAKMLFVAADSADDADAYSNNGATAPPPSRIIDRYRRNVEVVMPGMAVAFGCIILAIMVIGLLLGSGVAAAQPILVLSRSQASTGDTYSATASGFAPGEVVQFSWVGPTHGTMGAAPPADSGGSTTLGPIVENDPPGNYTLIATGQTSGHTASTGLQVAQRPTSAAAGADSLPPRGWVLTTDPPTGISVTLPVQPSVENTSTTTDAGDTLPLRQYTLNLSDGRGQVLFEVIDAPDRILDLDKGLQAVVAGTGTGGTVTSSRHLNIDSHPVVDARYTTSIDGSPYVVFARIVGDRGHVIAIVTLGPVGQENALSGPHQQILNTLHLI